METRVTLLHFRHIGGTVATRLKRYAQALSALCRAAPDNRSCSSDVKLAREQRRGTRTTGGTARVPPLSSLTAAPRSRLGASFSTHRLQHYEPKTDR